MSKKTSAVKAVNEPIDGELVDAETVSESINQLHKEAMKKAVNAIQDVIRCGNLLVEVKASLKHGEWADWVEAHLVFSVRTAQMYIKAAKAAAEGLPFNSLKELYGPSHIVDAHERGQRDAERDAPVLTTVAADIALLNKSLEELQLPLKDAGSFVAEAGVDFLTNKAAVNLEWLVALFDTVMSKSSLPGR